MQPAWIASTVLVLTGIGMILFGHFEGAYTVFLIFGILVLSLGITVSAFSGGVTHPLVLLGIFFILVVFLIAVDFYNLGGLRGWI